MTRLARTGLVLAATALAGVLVMLVAVAGEDPIAVMPATAIAGLLAGAARSRAAGVGAFAALLGAMGAGEAITPGSIVPALMLPGAMFGTGLALAERERVAERLALQAAELEAEQETYARLSVRYERARIAAELHDVVAHAISVMVVQASAGQRLAERDPAAVGETFAVIGAAARAAEADLDRLAALLAQDAESDDGDLRLVQELVERAGASGLPVTLRLEGDGASVRGAVAHAACRVVQEGLTNALRYAPGAPVTVSVAARPARVDVEVANAPARRSGGLGLGSGRGLTGLREGVAACGGTLHAGPDSSGGWAVQARIPRMASAVADTLP